MTTRRVLVAGASGVIGRAALEAFGVAPGWDALGLSRRSPDVELGRHLPLDLLDPEACAAALRAGPPVTHVVYCALQERPGLVPGWFDRELMQTNRRMLASLLDALEPQDALEHVSLLQGAKAYGAHLHPMRVPGREGEARDPHESFYWLQEDLLRERASRAGFGFTIWRPPIVFGHAVGAPMNPLAAIGTFAAISKAEGRPLCWPGGATAPLDGVDARLLAQAFLWAADAPQALGEVFNISNGDVFVWENVWSRVAAAMEMALGEPEPQRLSESMPAKAGVWDELVAHHELRAPGLMQLVGDSYTYVDLLFNAGGDRPPPPSLLSTIKLRRAGFGACMDSEEMIVEWLRWMQKRCILPAR
ncbi:MAG: NAD-dependent epimerase/dehydratase family protein [Deltaproteobacteria bacterium]|nr:NAD-dependent epimerase/dehydratase family protein [Deltaproteobacteria bacterium]MBW2361517.1 NAD-dependent epimerase/dehydratase family protein [Deltaproteobacteria bacterium]